MRSNARTKQPTGFALTWIVLGMAGCVGGAAPMQTALGPPIESDGLRYSVTVETAGNALRLGTNALTVHVTNADGSAAILTRIVAWMPAHGHASNAPDIVDRGGGRFDVQSLDLTMPGEWLISLKLSRDGSTEDDAATIWADPQ